VRRRRGWYLARGIRKELNIPLNIGERSIGGLRIFRLIITSRSNKLKLGYAPCSTGNASNSVDRLADEAKLAAIARAEEAKLAAILEESVTASPVKFTTPSTGLHRRYHST